MNYWPWAVAIGLPSLAILGGMIWRWRCHNRGERLIGPLLPYELIRLARRGLQPRLRTFLVALLFVGLLFVYGRSFHWSTAVTRNAMSDFGESFLIVFLIVQLIAVILITPVYAAGAMSEEKDRKTLEFLQTSLLTSREIVFGKLFARLGFVFAILFAGLPVLMLTSLFGGVVLERLLLGYAITAVAAVHLASFSMMMAAYQSSLRAALFWTYAMLLATTFLGTGIFGCFPLMGGFSAPTALGSYCYSWFRDPLFKSGWIGTFDVDTFLVIHLSLSAIFLYSTVRALRPGETARGAKRELRPQTPPPIRTSPVNFEISHHAIRPYAVLRLTDEDNPIVWLERSFHRHIAPESRGCLQIVFGLGIVFTLVPLTLIFAVVAMIELAESGWFGQTLNIAVRVAMAIFIFTIPFLIGLRTVSVIGKERQQQTLLTLLTIPWSRGEILAAKLQAAWRRIVTPVKAVGITLAIGVVLLAVNPFGAIAAAILFLGFTAFTSTLGLWLSVRLRTTLRATLAFVVIWLIAMIGPLLAYDGPVLRSSVVAMRCSPPFGVWHSLHGWNKTYKMKSDPATDAAVAFFAGVAFFLVAWGLWKATVSRFEREGKE